LLIKSRTVSEHIIVPFRKHNAKSSKLLDYWVFLKEINRIGKQVTRTYSNPYPYVILKLIHVLVQTDHRLKGISNGLDMATSGLHDQHVEKNNEKILLNQTCNTSYFHIGDQFSFVNSS
jgi:hypothetical protein